MKPQRRIKGIWIPIEIWETEAEGMTTNHRCIFAEIDSLSSPGHPCRVSNGYLARFFKISAVTVSRCISFLHEKGFIRVWYEKAGHNGRCMEVLNLYQNDKPPYQNVKGPYQNDIHRIPLDNHLENLSYIKEKEVDCNPRKRAVLFSKSKANELDFFVAAFESTDYQHINFRYYYEAVKNWSAAKQVKRKDWIAVAKNFMLKDKRDGKLVLSNPNNTSHGNKTIDSNQARRLATLGKNRRH